MGRAPSQIYLLPVAPGTSAADRYTKPTGKKLIAFGWYGGKFNYLNWLLPLDKEAQVQ